MPRGQGPALAVPVRRDPDLAAALERGETRDRGDLVLAQQARDPAGQGAHHLVLAREHLAQVEPQVARLDAVGGQEVAQVVVVVGGVQQRLRGDAPDVQAGAAERRLAARVEPRVHTRGAEPELGGPDCRDVPARAGSDDYDVEVVHGILS